MSAEARLATVGVGGAIPGAKPSDSERSRRRCVFRRMERWTPSEEAVEAAAHVEFDLSNRRNSGESYETHARKVVQAAYAVDAPAFDALREVAEELHDALCEIVVPGRFPEIGLLIEKYRALSAPSTGGDPC